MKTIKYSKFRIILVIPVCNLTLPLTLPSFLPYLTLPTSYLTLHYILPYLILPYHTTPYVLPSIPYYTLP